MTVSSKSHASPETARLEALAEFDILDTPEEEAFDRIARLTSQIFGVEIGIVSMIDGHRQWYKAVQGLPSKEASLEETFCRHTLLGEDVLVVPDATQDDRFRDNPHVLGGPRVRFYAGAPLRTLDGTNVGTLCAIGDQPRAFTAREGNILRDLAGLVMRELELRKLATVDALTGCMSRRAFKIESQRLIALAHRHQDELSLISFDLDHFKSINDTLGHAGGDQVLVEVAAAIRQQLRETDLLGRLGGEEFAVLLPRTGLVGAMEAAEKLRLVIEAISGKVGFPVSASLGVATLRRPQGIDDLLEEADKALYLAKDGGRNRALAAEGTTPSASPKRRVLKAGKIWFNNRRSMIDCTVRSIGDDGAELHVFSPIGIPADFTLTIPADGFEVQCRLQSSTKSRLHVSFGAE